MPSFEYHVPTTLGDAVGLLSKLEGAIILQGGTDLVVAAKLKGLKPKHVISLKRLKRSLSGVREEDGRVFIGASTTFDVIGKSELIEKTLQPLHEAANLVGSPQIRSVATIGGNLCNASPAADSAPPLLVLEAQLEVQGADGEKKIPVDGFFKGPGKTALQKGDILKGVVVPIMPQHSGAAFVKLGRRIGEDISIASAAAFVTMDRKVIKDARIALGSVAPTPIRARRTEGLVKGKALSDELLREAGRTAMQESNPITDVRAAGSYRKNMVGVLTRTALKEAVSRASIGGV